MKNLMFHKKIKVKIIIKNNELKLFKFFLQYLFALSTLMVNT